MTLAAFGSRAREPSSFPEGITLTDYLRRAAVAIGAAALILGTLGAGVASAATHPHKNATLVCAFNCFNLSNLQLDGTGFGSFIQNAHGGATGGSLNMRAEGINKENEDFGGGFITDVGTVGVPGSGACDTGLLPATSIFCTNATVFSADPVFEANFAPDSNETGLCVGLAVKGVPQPVSLMPCGATTRTLWVGDAAQGLGGDCRIAGNYCPWIAASDTYLSHPLVLTVDNGTRHPANQLGVTRENPSGGLVQDYQQFTTEPGPAF